jgi:hypothetical protein
VISTASSPGITKGTLYTGAAHIETLARRLVLACAQPAYRTQRTNAPGQYIGLGALFSALQVGGLDESWTRVLPDSGEWARPDAVNQVAKRHGVRCARCAVS